MGSALVEAKRIEFDDAAPENLEMNRGARTVEDEAEGGHEEIENPPTPGQLILDEFDAIHAKYYRRIYRQCFRMVRNQEDAEDLTQEVFLLLYRKAHTFRGEANFSTWLHRLTINTVLMKLRSHRRWRESVSSLDVASGPDHDSNENATLASTIPAPPTSTVEKISLDIAIGQLSGGYREVFLLHDSEGYRHDEIARMLGISEGTSKSQLHKARFRLRKLVESGNIRRVKFAPAEVETDGAESDRYCVPSTKVITAARRPGSMQHRKRISHKEHMHSAAA